MAPRPNLSTTARGLGAEHQRRRAAMPKPHGQPCPFCADPMWPDQALDADHVVPRAAGGGGGPLRWAHSSCNRRAGGLLSAAFRARRRIRSREW